jgi:protease-4
MTLSIGRKWTLTLFFAATMTGCISISLFPTTQPFREKTVQGTAGQKILMIDLSGVIAEKATGGALGQADDLVARVKEELTMAGEDDQVKALLLRINSPGGTVTASDLIHHELTQFRAKHRVPIVAIIMDVGASGGYYVAAAADKIVAHPTSVTGSVGVIMLRVNAEGLLQKIGLEAGAIKSGDKKDIGSPFRQISEDERAILQAMIDGFQTRFLEVVAKGRSNLSAERLKIVADGRVLTGPQALQLGLVDQIGYLDDAIEIAKQAAGLKDARVVIYHRPGSYKNNIYSQAQGEGGLEALARLDIMSLVRGGTPQFLYLWMP